MRQLYRLKKEYGGYIEVEQFRNKMLYDNAILLNSARDCSLYLFQSRVIKKIWIPYFLCDTVYKVCCKNDINYDFYHIDKNWLPVNVKLQQDEYIYIVNYYGQLDEAAILALKTKYGNIIVDNTQAYFNAPFEGIDTLYSYRKYFGVPDGGVLFTDAHLDCDMEQEVSYSRMNFLLGRYEKTASEFYSEYVANNDYSDTQPMKSMSKLTKNLLHGIDYEFVKQRRTENFKYLHGRLGKINQLKLNIPSEAFAYPLMLENASEIRKQLIKQKIYIPLLWPNVLDECAADSWEYKLASDVLPLPVDQRYDLDDMKYIAKVSDIIKSNVHSIDFIACYEIYLLPKGEMRNYILTKYLHLFEDFGEVSNDTLRKINMYATFIIIKKAGEVLGFAAFYCNDTKTKISYLTLIGVDRQYQNKNIGSILLKYVANFSKCVGMKFLKLEVSTKNQKAIMFYQRHGFVYTENKTQDSFFMCRDLLELENK